MILLHKSKIAIDFGRMVPGNLRILPTLDIWWGSLVFGIGGAWLKWYFSFRKYGSGKAFKMNCCVKEMRDDA